jgi:hypothetical protein
LAEVDAAVQALENPTTRLTHRLLRFSVVGTLDQEAWNALASEGDPDCAQEIWAASPESQFNHARLLWFLCDGDYYPLNLTCWKAFFSSWGELPDHPGFRAEIMQAGVDDTFERPASHDDYRRALAEIPSLLESVVQGAGLALKNSDDEEEVARFLAVLDESELTPGAKDQLLRTFSQPFLDGANQEAEELLGCSINEASLYLEIVTRQLQTCRLVRAAESVQYQQLRRRVGNKAREFAVQFEKLGNLDAALLCIEHAEELLAGTPDAALLTPHAARIKEAVAQKSAAPTSAPIPQVEAPKPKPTPLVVSPQPVVVSSPRRPLVEACIDVLENLWDCFSPHAKHRILDVLAAITVVIWLMVAGLVLTNSIMFGLAIFSAVALFMIYEWLSELFHPFHKLGRVGRAFLTACLLLAVTVGARVVVWDFEVDYQARKHEKWLLRESKKLPTRFESLTKLAVEAKEAWIKYLLVKELAAAGFVEYAEQVTEARYDLRFHSNWLASEAEDLIAAMHAVNEGRQTVRSHEVFMQTRYWDIERERLRVAYLIRWSREMDDVEDKQALQLRLVAETAAEFALDMKAIADPEHFVIGADEAKRVLAEELPWKN